MLSGCCDKVRQLVGAMFQVFQIEHALGESSKEPRHSVFEHLAARAEQRSIWIELASERNEIAFVSTGAMQQQQCPVRTTGNELVNEIRLRPHDLAKSLTSNS